MNEKTIYDSASERHSIFLWVGELLRYRDFVRNLIARDLKVRYKRSTIGFLWTMLNPLLTMGTLVIIFSTLFRTEIDHYPTYILSGLLTWNVFSQGSVAAMNSLLGNSGSLRKTYVPAAVFVLSGVGGAVVNFIFAFIPLIVFALLDGLSPAISWSYAIVVLCQLTVLTIGIGFMTAAAVVFFADVLEIYQVLLNLLFFLTPIMYPLRILSPELLTLEHFNPLFYIVNGFRTAIIDRAFPALDLVVLGTSVPLAFFVVGWLIFTRVESKFAYYV